MSMSVKRQQFWIRYSFADYSSKNRYSESVPISPTPSLWPEQNPYNTHTHTHTRIYIYIYMNVYKRKEKPNEGKSKWESERVPKYRSTKHQIKNGYKILRAPFRTISKSLRYGRFHSNMNNVTFIENFDYCVYYAICGAYVCALYIDRYILLFIPWVVKCNSMPMELYT